MLVHQRVVGRVLVFSSPSAPVLRISHNASVFERDNDGRNATRLQMGQPWLRPQLITWGGCLLGTASGREVPRMIFFARNKKSWLWFLGTEAISFIQFHPVSSSFRGASEYFLIFFLLQFTPDSIFVLSQTWWVIAIRPSIWPVLMVATTPSRWTWPYGTLENSLSGGFMIFTMETYGSFVDFVGVFKGGITEYGVWYTLWLCQNSYWKYPIYNWFTSSKWWFFFYSYVSLPECNVYLCSNMF